MLVFYPKIKMWKILILLAMLFSVVRCQIGEDEAESDPLEEFGIYSKCDTLHPSTYCRGVPIGCEHPSNRPCRMLAVITNTGAEVTTEIAGPKIDATTDMWLGVAVSKDDKMGDDSVYECHFYQGKMYLTTSYNFPNRTNEYRSRAGILGNAKSDPGGVYCRFKEPVDRFPYSEDKPYLLFAMGEYKERVGKFFKYSLSKKLSLIHLLTVKMKHSERHVHPHPIDIYDSLDKYRDSLDQTTTPSLSSTTTTTTESVTEKGSTDYEYEVETEPEVEEITLQPLGGVHEPTVGPQHEGLDHHTVAPTTSKYDFSFFKPHIVDRPTVKPQSGYRGGEPGTVGASIGSNGTQSTLYLSGVLWVGSTILSIAILSVSCFLEHILIPL